MATVLLLLFLPVFTAIFSLIFHTSFLVSTLMFFGLPALWLSLRNPHEVGKTAIFALIGLPFSIYFDYFAVLDRAWYVPVTAFPFRLFGYFPLEEAFWAFLFIYDIVLFYKQYFDSPSRSLFAPGLKLVPFMLIPLVAFMGVSLALPDHTIPYAYLWFGLVFYLIPLVLFLLKFPRLLPKFAKTGAYFFFQAVLVEYTAQALNQWSFPGPHFLGWISLLNYPVPFEEFFLWFVLGSSGILTYYEFFDDDRK